MDYSKYFKNYTKSINEILDNVESNLIEKERELYSYPFFISYNIGSDVQLNKSKKITFSKRPSILLICRHDI